MQKFVFEAPKSQIFLQKSQKFAKNRFVYQAVHMVFNGDFGEKFEEGEKRQCKLVFIGKDLDKEALEQGFRACVMSEEKIQALAAARSQRQAEEMARQQKILEKLRFRLGDKVLCNTAEGWSAGKIVDLMYWQEGMRGPAPLKKNS